jgi:hypothetical protein
MPTNVSTDNLAGMAGFARAIPVVAPRKLVEMLVVEIVKSVPSRFASHQARIAWILQNVKIMNTANTDSASQWKQAFRIAVAPEAISPCRESAFQGHPNAPKSMEAARTVGR